MEKVNYNSIYTISVLKKLGTGEKTTFNNRLKTQKIQYISQLFGLTPFYNFNLYYYGPYSPELTKSLFSIKESDIIQNLEFSSPDIEDRYNKVKKIINNKNLRELELVTTYHLLRFIINLRENTAISRLKELKYATEKEIKWVMMEVLKLPR